MKKVLITGATGMVGSQVLKVLLDEDGVGEVVYVGRRSTGKNHEKLKEIIHNNFLNYSGIKDDLGDIDACFYCLAVYQSQVSKEEYVEITCDYQKALTDVLEKSSPNLTFVLFGASGADPSENSRVSFARVKGRAENLLSDTSFPIKYIFRPGYIHPTGKKPSSTVYRALLPLAGGLLKLLPILGTTDKELATAMVKVGLSGEREPGVLENSDIRKYI